jgi:hypothetical protein
MSRTHGLQEIDLVPGALAQRFGLYHCTPYVRSGQPDLCHRRVRSCQQKLELPARLFHFLHLAAADSRLEPGTNDRAVRDLGAGALMPREPVAKRLRAVCVPGDCLRHQENPGMRRFVIARPAISARRSSPSLSKGTSLSKEPFQRDRQKLHSTYKSPRDRQHSQREIQRDRQNGTPLKVAPRAFESTQVLP